MGEEADKKTFMRLAGCLLAWCLLVMALLVPVAFRFYAAFINGFERSEPWTGWICLLLTIGALIVGPAAVWIIVRLANRGDDPNCEKRPPDTL